MTKWMDKLEDAAFRLRDLGKKAVENASESFEKARPTIQENIDKAREEVSDAFEKAKPAVKEGLDKIAEGTQTVYEKAKPHIEDGLEKLSNAYEKAINREPQKDEEPETQEEALAREVDEQVETIRAAKETPTSISEFVARKYGKHAARPESAPKSEKE